MNSLDIAKSFEYENYIKLARLCDTGDFGASNIHMINLILKEKDSASIDQLSHSKLLNEVKNHIRSATEFALNRNITENQKEQLSSLLTHIQSAQTSDKLITICKSGMDIFFNYRSSC